MSNLHRSPPATVPLLDVARDNAALREETLAAFARVLETGRFLHGSEVRQLEEQIAALCEVPHAIGCASGSDALLLSLMALEIGPGDEVIVPSFTFFATASAVWRVGAKIVFVDIDPATYNMDPQAFESAINPRTRAVIPVHLYGQCAELDSICTIAARHGLRVIEDAAQAIGARFRGRSAGAWGDVGCLSFYPTKNLGGCGDGGMLVTRDAEFAQRLRLFAAHGMHPRYFHQVVGINSRLDSLQAAALLVKLDRLAEWNRQRRQHAATYCQLFRDSSLWQHLSLPVEAVGCDHVWNQFSIRVLDGRRDRLREFLTQRGVGTEVYYPLPLHLQQCFSSLGYERGSFPASERAAAEVLHLPIFPGLRLDEQRAVVDQICGFFAACRMAA
jgi:dTDP-4-amino-4,6-dideoxygalactose transaminase